MVSEMSMIILIFVSLYLCGIKKFFSPLYYLIMKSFRVFFFVISCLGDTKILNIWVGYFHLI